jgi:hypothetical protein
VIGYNFGHGEGQAHDNKQLGVQRTDNCLFLKETLLGL